MPYHVLKNSSEAVLKAPKTHASSCMPTIIKHPAPQLKPKGVIHATATSLYKPLQASKTPSGYPCIDKAAVKASRAVLERSGSIAGFCRMQVLEGMEDIEDNKQLFLHKFSWLSSKS